MQVQLVLEMARHFEDKSNLEKDANMITWLPPLTCSYNQEFVP